MSLKNNKVKNVEKSQTVKEDVQQTKQNVESKQVVETKQVHKGGKKSTKQLEPAQVVEPTPDEVETKQTQKGSKKSTKQVESTPVDVETKQIQKSGKKSTTKEKVEPVAVQVDKQKLKVEVEAEEEGEEQVGGKLRYFKLFYNEEFQGRYCGRKPKQAANKAFSSIVKDMKKNGNQKDGVDVDINFSIRECTRNSKHKEYNYVGVRKELEEPVEVKINNDDGSVKKIIYSFHNKISKAPKVQA